MVLLEIIIIRSLLQNWKAHEAVKLASSVVIVLLCWYFTYNYTVFPQQIGFVGGRSPSIVALCYAPTVNVNVSIYTFLLILWGIVNTLGIELFFFKNILRSYQEKIAIVLLNIILYLSLHALLLKIIYHV